MTIGSTTLGRGGPRISRLGLGCMSMTGGYGPGDDGESRRTLARAVDLGVTLFDTADVYGDGENERLVGEALRPHRAAVTIATKFGRIMDHDNPAGNTVCGRPDYVRSSCDASLARLGIDTIDLYYLHRVDPQVPIEETVGAMAELVTAGKVRFLGLSEARAETVRRAHATHPIAALQSEYSLFTRDVEENGVLATLRELGITLVPFSPMGRGMLTGAVRDAAALPPGDSRRRHPRFQAENLERNLRIVDELTSIARARGLTSAQLALAWLVHQGDDVVPIPGSKRTTHLDENVAAANVTLSADELQRIDALVPAGAVAGRRDSGNAFLNG